MTTLFHNMNYLLSSADQYVWFYSEQHLMFSPAAPATGGGVPAAGARNILRVAVGLTTPEQLKATYYGMT